MIEFKFSQSYEAKRKRLSRLPKMFEDHLDTITKKDALGIIDTFQKGIERDEFGLKRLKKETKARKKRKGYKNVKSPLLGMASIAKDEKRTYKNMLIIRRTKKGYRIRPSKRKHHSGKMTLKGLFDVHENGAVINNPGGQPFFFKNGEIVYASRNSPHAHRMPKTKPYKVVIPPRPAFKMAYKKYLKKRRSMERASDIRKAMTEYVNSGNMSKARKLLKRPKNWSKYDE